MDKELENKDKIDISRQEPSGTDAGAAMVGAYDPKLTHKTWEQSGKPWNSTPQGRLAIRLVTRGVLGAAFFTVGQTLNYKWMKNYDHTAGLLKQENPLAALAKILDTVVARPIELTVNRLGGDGKKAITFRTTANHTSAMAGGRSLGHEVVNVTFDFFCASIGDAWGRDMASWVDPNVKKKWIKNGHIDYPQALKSTLQSVWRYVTYNGGEDWAVAIPYVYFMKGHRALVNHFSPGFEYDFDRTRSGGSFKMQGNQVVGNYNRAGAFDLQHRFVVYNMGTLAYRELYDFAGKKLRGEKAVLYGAPDKPEPKNIVEKTGNLFKWMARSVIKAGIYMTPAVPFFWITRAPQGKHRGMFIDAEHGVLMHQDAATGKMEPLTIDYQGTPQGLHYSQNPTHILDHSYNPLPRDPFSNTEAPGLGNKLLNAAGKGSNSFRKKVAPIGAWANEEKNSGWAGRKIKSALGVTDFKNVFNTYADAAVSYTPYMYAKAEFANLWDNGKTDLAAERLIDGATHLNWGEFKAGLREIGYAVLHKPLPDAARDREAERRIKIDTSAADTSLIAKNEMHGHHAPEEAAPLSWRERVVQGEKPEVGANDPKSYAEREDMREALKDLQPPTNSIN